MTVAVLDKHSFTPDQIQLLQATICRGSTSDEFQLFLHACKKTGLDPFMRQIYAVKRWDSGLKREVMAIQVGIDGFRAIADKSGNYAPGKETTFTYDKDGILVSATAFVKKQTKDGTWHEVAATAHYNEYYGKTKDGTATSMWATKPHIMLGKCFTPDTEILTVNGFERFDSVNSKILQYKDGELTAVDVMPFSQKYEGEMIVCNSDMINFMVTPNHDMVTTFGKVEAGAMYETSHSRGPWIIPMTTGNQIGASSIDMELLGYVLADGWYSSGFFNVAVSKPYKIEALRKVAPLKERIQHSKGSVAEAGSRQIITNFDKQVFVFPFERLSKWLTKDKEFIDSELLSKEECKTIIDAWQRFDGHTNNKTGVKRIYTSRKDHKSLIEVMAIKAGYTISQWKERTSDISDTPNWYLTISDQKNIPVYRNSTNSSLVKEMNPFKEVWCVTVPSGIIVVRRNGFSMLCGNCAEALALRKAFPYELSGVYAPEEMGDAEGAKGKVIEIQATIDEERIAAFIQETGLEVANVEKYVAYIGEVANKEKKLSREEVYLKVIQDPVKFTETYKMWEKKFN
jgi:phage recombination protein Bet